MIILFLWSITSLTAQASAIIQTRSFRTNLVRGEYADEEVQEPEESVDDEPIDVAELVITDLAEIAEPDNQKSDEHGEINAPNDIEPIVD